MKLRDYHFKNIFNKLKGTYPTLNLVFKEDTLGDGHDEIKIMYDGNSVFDEDKLEIVNELVSFIETYGYKMGNPLLIYLNFRL